MIDDYGFPVGSRVVMLGEDPCDMVSQGMTGTVCHIVDICEFPHDCNIGVEWDIYHTGFHNCNGNCDYGHGRYVPHTCLALHNVDLGEIQTSEADILSLFI